MILIVIILINIKTTFTCFYNLYNDKNLIFYLQIFISLHFITPSLNLTISISLNLIKLFQNNKTNKKSTAFCIYNSFIKRIRF
jgi:hypothetical protein